MIEVERLMVHATISTLKLGRELGVNDMGLLEDWKEKLDAQDNIEVKSSGKRVGMSSMGMMAEKFAKQNKEVKKNG